LESRLKPEKRVQIIQVLSAELYDETEFAFNQYSKYGLKLYPSWPSKQRPEELAQFWAQEYPAMSTIDKVKTDIQQNGYEILKTLALPESDWENYYNPLRLRIKEYENDPRPEMQEVVSLTSAEISMREKYSSYYDYVAFVLKI